MENDNTKKTSHIQREAGEIYNLENEIQWLFTKQEHTYKPR